MNSPLVLFLWLLVSNFETSVFIFAVIKNKKMMLARLVMNPRICCTWACSGFVACPLDVLRWNFEDDFSGNLVSRGIFTPG